jgi:hypothetical protein
VNSWQSVERVGISFLLHILGSSIKNSWLRA